MAKAGDRCPLCGDAELQVLSELKLLACPVCGWSEPLPKKAGKKSG